MKEIDHEHTDNLVCPYCGYENEDTWELGESDTKHQCYSCNKFFSYETQVYRTFSSSKADCFNGGDHDWTKPMDFETYFWKQCRACRKSEKAPK